MMMPGGPHQFGLSPRMMNQLNAQMTMAAAAAAASGQPPPGLGPRGALAGRMRFPGSYFMWSFFVFLSNNPRIWDLKSLTTAHLIRYAADPELPDTQMDQTSKTRQKCDWKNSWNSLIILVPVTIWQILNLKEIQLLEMEVMWIYRNLQRKICEIIELIFGEF